MLDVEREYNSGVSSERLEPIAHDIRNLISIANELHMSEYFIIHLNKMALGIDLERKITLITDDFENGINDSTRHLGLIQEAILDSVHMGLPADDPVSFKWIIEIKKLLTFRMLENQDLSWSKRIRRQTKRIFRKKFPKVWRFQNSCAIES
jgi:hypothetical protein